ncbi:hypothetical protein M747DRAFT_311136 [Aspergillus niger ATCC 13496]|uniref:Contig An08c0280, genomic contig n=3 Tax=Aspergillus niger TaxID=5061 RepID=A2QSN5_ASPNC|nr:uncharacterized protein An08g11360 [Aspergillus niger]RDH14109.1 hypothetical protein M747DRAFT_311136 [Aspergillus niger ATCC 13496]CAK45807.1 unnamed protein product [Aspergillus niger]
METFYISFAKDNLALFVKGLKLCRRYKVVFTCTILLYMDAFHVTPPAFSFTSLGHDEHVADLASSIATRLPASVLGTVTHPALNPHRTHAETNSAEEVMTKESLWASYEYSGALISRESDFAFDAQ